MAIRDCAASKAMRPAATMADRAGTSRRLAKLIAFALFGLSTILPTVVFAQNSLLNSEGSAAIDKRIRDSDYVIPNTFFGMHINNVNTPWPTAYFANQRLEGSDVNWWNIEEAPGLYDYFWLDQWTANAQEHNVTLIYTFVGVPQFYSSMPSDDRCTFELGACDPPKDLNEDGTGTDQAFKNFVTDLMIHNAEQGNPIQYFEMWNEPDIAKQWIPTCENPGKKCTGNLKFAQLLRMAADGYAIIKSFNPHALVLTPAPVGFEGGLAAKWMGEYLAALTQEGGPYPDVIAFHGYLNKWIMGFFPTPENEAKLVPQMKDVVEKNKLGKLPLWITEGSWGNTILDGYTNDVVQAAFLARYTLLQESSGVARGYWYQWDQPGGDGTLWQGSGGGGNWKLPGYAYNSIVNWTMGATLTSPCTNQKGTTIWVCKYLRTIPFRYQAEIIWNSAGTSSYPVPQAFNQYCDLKGDKMPLTGIQNNNVPIGIWPILLENADLAKGPCRQY